VSSSSSFRKHLYKHLYSYKQLRDIPVSQLSEDQFNYIVKSILYSAMGYYDKKARSRRHGRPRL
jgi:hypothetical protein